MSDFVPKFAALDPPKGRWSTFCTSYLLEIGVIALVVNIAIAFPEAPKLIAAKTYEHIALVSEPPLKQTPKPRVKPLIPPPEVKVVAKFEAPMVRVLPNPDMPKIPEVKLKVQQPFPKFESARVDLPPGPKVGKKVEQTIFASTGSSAAPTLNMPAHKVQTGGFGDPNGVAPNPNAKGKPTIAAVGSFDLPPGDGQGNGTGGSRGARGTVVSAGFGNGMAVQGGGGRGNGGVPRVQNTVFTQATATSDPTPRRKETQVAAKTTPVAINAKPTPSYTEEARQLKIEGEVLLDVVFSANGDVQVVRVVRGLGHGLDESAMRAAKNIKFSPATRDGQAVDFEARIHIVFQMS
jgi:TonB family protein